MIELKPKVQNLIVGIIFTIVPFINYSELYAQDSINTETHHELSVLSYNIHHANPPSLKDSIDLPAIINVIKNSKADLVALQEIDSNTKRSGFGNQAQQIAKALGMHVFFGKAIDFENGDYGVAILSKFPIVKSLVHHLPSKSDTNGELRVLAMSLIKVADDKLIWFASTHLDSQKENTNRLLQIQKIIEITKQEVLPVVIAGDFNDVEKSPVIDILDKSFTRTCKSCSPTIPVINPIKAIDFIAFKPKKYFKIKNHSVLPETYASDHLPIMTVLKF